MVSIPTRAVRDAGPPRTLTLRFVIGKQSFRRTVRIVQPGALAVERKARLLDLEPAFCIRSAHERSPMKRLSDQRLYAEGLRRAGLPED